MRRIKVIQCYTGAIAKEQIRQLAHNPEIELVGAYVFHDDKVGMDLGEIAGIEPLGVFGTKDLQSLLDLDADVVLHNSPGSSMDLVLEFLAAGKNVISATTGYNPKIVGMEEQLTAACKKGHSTMMGTGVNPEYAPDVLPMVASAICSKVDQVHIYAGGDLRGAEARVLELFGFGKRIEDVQANDVMFGIIADAYKQPLYLTAQALNLEIDATEVDIQVEAAIRDVEDKVSVRKGTTGGIRVSMIGKSGGERTITIELTWFMGRKSVRAEWLGRAQTVGWAVDVKGRPNVEMTVVVDSSTAGPGWHNNELTAARMVNSIPDVVSAAPGILTYLSAPIPRAWNRTSLSPAPRPK